MTNPYVSRGPVRDPAMFYGRAHELDDIASFLHGYQSVSLIGPRKMGKTSLLFHLMRPALWPTIGIGESNLFVYIDCEVLGDGSPAEIFSLFASEISLALDERALPQEPTLDKVVDRPTRLALETAIRRLNRRGLQIVLILDEFERLGVNPQLDLNFFNALRSIAGRYRLVFITSSARSLIDLTYTGRAQEILSSPFFNIFAPVFLGPLDPAEARGLIDEPSRRVGMPIEPDTQDHIYAFAGGHPLVLQIACFHTCDVSGEWETAEEYSTRELEAHFLYYWQNLSADEQQTMLGVVEGESRPRGQTDMRGLTRSLSQKGLLEAHKDTWRSPFGAWTRFVAARAEEQRRVEQVEQITRDRNRDESAGVAPELQSTLVTEAALRTLSYAENSVQTEASPPSIIWGSERGALTGLRFGPYEVREHVGRGAMSQVYRGCHTRLGRTVAIKVLPASMAADDGFRIRFEREARVVAGLRHPNIVQIHDFGDLNGMYYMVMEFIDGPDQSVYIKRTAPLTLAQAWPLVRDVASALDHAHEQGLVHRDVKPSNVMLETGGPGASAPRRAVLTDFGITKILSVGIELTNVGNPIGTPAYMAPEQIKGYGPIDKRADIYSLGVVMYEMLTGSLPFTGARTAVMMAHLLNPCPDPRTVAPSVPEAVALAIQRALAKTPRDRFDSAGELALVLRPPQS